LTVAVAFRHLTVSGAPPAAIRSAGSST